MRRKWAAVVVAAGKGKRMRRQEKKQYLTVGGKPVLAHTLEALGRIGPLTSIIVVVGEEDLERVRDYPRAYPGVPQPLQVVAGGAERQQSVYAGLLALEHTGVEYVLVHDGVRPFLRKEAVEACMEQAERSGAAVLAVPVKDTIKRVDERGIILSTPDRDSLRAIQTPQAFRLSLLLEAHRAAAKGGYIATDDAILVERIGHAVHTVPGDERNMKITTPEDLAWSEWMLGRSEADMIRVGHGYDVHRLVSGRPCIIGGVHIPHDKGLDGHSDADVLLHAIADAVLGALAKGDIGRHFPDTDPTYKDADSAELLTKVWQMAKADGYRIANVDATVMAERPKLALHIPRIEERIAALLEAEPSRINVKATTSERLGFVGREEGIAAQAVVCLQKNML